MHVIYKVANIFNSSILSSFTLVVTHPELQCLDLPEHFLPFPQVRTFSFQNSVSSHGNCISGISTANVLESAWKTAEPLLLRPLQVTQPVPSQCIQYLIEMGCKHCLNHCAASPQRERAKWKIQVVLRMAQELKIVLQVLESCR